MNFVRSSLNVWMCRRAVVVLACRASAVKASGLGLRGKVEDSEDKLIDFPPVQQYQHQLQ